MNNGTRKGMEPPDKRRKTHNMSSFPENLEVWDDDNDFTIDELENIDKFVSMSQIKTTNTSEVLRSVKPNISTGRSLGRGTGRSNSMGDMGRPWTTNPAKKSSASQVYSADSLRHKKQLLSNNSNKCSVTNKGTAVMPPRASAHHSHLTPVIGITGSGTSADLPCSQTRQPPVLQNNIEKTREEIEFYKKQVEELKRDQMSKDGQIKILRTSLREREAELTHQKQERMILIGQHQQEQSEKEKSLDKEIERLKTQLQFKDHEIVELQQNCRKLDQRLKTSFNSQGDSQCQSPSRQRPPPHSPKIHQSPQLKKKPPTSPRTPSRPAFPTRDTFLAEERSPSRSKNISTTNLCSKPAASQTKERFHQKQPRRMCLQLAKPKGLLTGCHLVSRLMNTSSYKILDSSVTPAEGVLGLLQFPLHSDPQRNKTALRLLMSSTNSASQPSAQFINSEHYSLARDSLPELLAGHVADGEMTTARNVLQSNTHSSVSVLPLIEDCVSAYVNYLQSTCVPSTQSTQSVISATLSKSTFLSLDSWVGSRFGRMSHPSTDSSVSTRSGGTSHHSNSYVDLLELKARSALYVLRDLVTYCRYARKAIIGKQPLSKPTETAADSKQHKFAGNRDGSQGSVDDSPCNSAGHEQDAAFYRIVRQTQLLNMICRLANPLPNKQNSPSTAIVELCLRILTILARSVSSNTRFECVFTCDVLVNFRSDELPVCGQHRIRASMLLLLQSLVRWPFSLPHLCSRSDECLLSSVYNVGLFCNDNCCRSPLTNHMIGILSMLVGCHRHGARILLESDCTCSTELIKCVICVLYWELQHYRKLAASVSAQSTSRECSVRLLRQGAMLLATLAVHDRQFVQHHNDVEKHYYVELVCGLERIFRKHPAVPEHERTAIQDLWDFDQEYPESPPQEEAGMDKR